MIRKDGGPCPDDPTVTPDASTAWRSYMIVANGNANAYVRIPSIGADLG